MEALPVSRKSVVAVVITGIYLLLVVAAFAVLLIAGKEDSLAGIFVVLVAMPWTLLLTWIVDSFSLDSIMFNMTFSLLACLLNAWIIYTVITFFSRR